MTLQEAVSQARDFADQHVDDSDKWLQSFDSKMTELGFSNIKAPCQCADADMGHDPECGWGLKPAENPPADSVPERKWDLSLLGPRQGKAVKEAISAFGWRAKSYTEVWGTHGLPETQHQSSYTNLFGGGWTEQAKALHTMLLYRFHQPTAANYQHVVAEIQAAAKEIVLPLIDKRITLEEHHAREGRAQQARVVDNQRQALAEHERKESERKAAEAKSVHGISEPAAESSGIKVSRNADKGGIEIRFPGKPAAAVLENLKSNGWRFSRGKYGRWWKKYSPAALAFANRLAGIPVAIGEDQGLRDMTNVDSQYEESCERAVS